MTKSATGVKANDVIEINKINIKGVWVSSMPLFSIKCRKEL
jgi:hypothetical protein